MRCWTHEHHCRTIQQRGCHRSKIQGNSGQAPTDWDPVQRKYLYNYPGRIIIILEDTNEFFLI